MMYVRWAASVVIQERALANYAENQNLPSRAEGENLDALAKLFYTKKRPGATAATCTMRFTISGALTFAVLIPGGTRVTDASNTLVWETVKDIYVNARETYADVKIQCQTKGAAGNGFAAGQINIIVDLFAYFQNCANLNESDGGGDEASDEEFYELLRLSMDGYSCAGARGGYIYFAKQVDTKITDVIAASPTPGVVKLYVLMDDGTIATEEMKEKVLAACSADEVRPLTDFVFVDDPEKVEYNVNLTYYVQSNAEVSAETLALAVSEKVGEFTDWQSAKLGRDINPSRLISMLGRPVSHYLDDGLTLEVSRLCATGEKNACSMLYAAAARAAKAIGYRKIVTYTLDTEPGTSPRAAGWTCAGLAGGERWTGDRRPAADLYPAQMKLRYEKLL